MVFSKAAAGAPAIFSINFSEGEDIPCLRVTLLGKLSQAGDILILDSRIKDEVKYEYMAKSLLRLEARKLRGKGVSIKRIARELKVARSSVGHWVRDIVLTEEQLVLLKQSELNGKEKGRLKAAIIKKEKRKSIKEDFNSLGKMHIPSLNRHELLLVGLALYWAEGSKCDQTRRVEFCNSDPTMIKLFIKWLMDCFEVKREDLRGIVGINQIHTFRVEQVRRYWLDISGIPLEQFRKTSLKKAKRRKVYDNMNTHFGTLCIRLAKSTNLYYKIMGLIHGLHLARINQQAA